MHHLPLRRLTAARPVPCAAVLLALAVQCGLAQKGNELDRRYPVTDPKNFTRVVATVGDVAITAQEFLLSYEFGPAFAKRVKDSRSRYLAFMVDEKLLALDARSRGVQNSDRIRRPLRELEGDMATEELFKDDVLSRVSVSAAEVERGMKESRVHYRIQWLYSPDAAGAASRQLELGGGALFDSLFARELTGGVKRDDRSMESTLFRLRRTNPALAAVAETLRAGRNSAAVRGPDGYYIIRLADGWTDVTLSATETRKLELDARRALTQEKSDSLSDLYVRQMMLERNPVIIRETFDRLEAWLGGIWVKPEVFRGWEIAAKLPPGSDTSRSSWIERTGTDTLVSLAGGRISLESFLEWYRARDTYFRLATTSEQSFFLSVEDLVWRMVRDRLLVQRALRRNLQERDQVKKQLKWWEEKMLFGEEKAYLAGSIVVSDSACRAFYDANPGEFRTDSGGVKPFELVGDRARKECRAFELRKKMLHAIIALKRKYRVRVNDEVLNGLPIDVENNPRAIDVYTAKKGGTFPHPAFPAIDYEWQTWM